MKVISTGLIVLLVAMVGGVIGGVCVCAYFYNEGRRKRQVRPMDQSVAKMVEPFNTKKLWERGRRKPPIMLTENESLKTISVNGVIAKGPGSDGSVDNREMAELVEDVCEGGINPCSARVPSPLLPTEVVTSEPILPQIVPVSQQQEQQQPHSTTTTITSTVPTETTAVEVS